MAIASERRSPRLLILISVLAFATIFGRGSPSADESGASFWAAWDICQPCRRSGTARMVVLRNLFSRDLSRREQCCDSGYAPSFSADNAVAQARCGHQDERRYRHSHPRLHIRSADLGWAIGVQPFLAGRYSPNGDRRTCDRRAGTHRLRRSKQRQRQAHVIRRSGPPALMEIESGGEQFHDLY